MDGLDTEAYDRNYGDRELLRRIAHYFRPFARQMVLVAVMLTLNSVMRTGGPILISIAVDRLIADASMSVIWLLAFGVLLLGVSGWVFNYIRQVFRNSKL